MHEQERRVLDVLTAAVDIRPLVGRQMLDQPLPQGLKKLSQVGLSVGFFGWAGWMEMPSRVHTLITCADKNALPCV
jgi:hypothetical protein